jgi:hypothetical protein
LATQRPGLAKVFARFFSKNAAFYFVYGEAGMPAFAGMTWEGVVLGRARYGGGGGKTGGAAG